VISIVFVRAFVDQLPALVGVIIGTLATFGVTSLTDRTRWRRGQATRWDERRLETCAQYAQAIKEMHAVALRLLASRHPGLTAQPIDRAVGLEMLARAELERSKAWESMLLLGDSATIEAARIWRNSVMKVALLARDRDEQPAHGRDDLVISWEIEVSTAVDEVNEARDGYYLAARQGLSVSGTAQAQAHWLLAEGIAPSRGHAAASVNTCR